MKPLIAISSCQRDASKGLHQVIRDTWVKELPNGLDYKIFVGKNAVATNDDEVVLSNVDDGYYGLPDKTRENHRWALDNGYDFIFQCFVDTFIHPQRLLDDLIKNQDNEDFYTGWQLIHGGKYKYASGGAGYWLSSKLSKLILDKIPNLENYNDRYEDLWIGSLLQEQGYQVQHNANYIPDSDLGKCLPENDIITVHLSRGTGAYNSQWMFDNYKVAFKDFEVFELLKI